MASPLKTFHSESAPKDRAVEVPYPYMVNSEKYFSGFSLTGIWRFKSNRPSVTLGWQQESTSSTWCSLYIYAESRSYEVTRTYTKVLKKSLGVQAMYWVGFPVEKTRLDGA